MLKSQNVSQIEKQFTETQKLNKMCQGQEYSLKALESDKAKLVIRNEELTTQLNQLTSQLNSKESNLSFNRNKLDDAEKDITRFQVR